MCWAAIWLLIFFHTDARARQPQPEIIEPSYRIDPTSVLEGTAVPQLGTHETPWVPVITLDFLNNERLAATLVAAANAGPGLATRDKPDAASPFRLRGVVLEASTGRVLATPEWPSNSRAAGILAANDKGFVIEIGNDLTLLSPDLKPVKLLTLPSPSAVGGQPGGSDWRPVARSWSGKHVLLTAGPAWAVRPWLWLDAEKLRALNSWVDAATGSISVSDDEIVLEPFSQHFGDPPASLMAEVPGGPWKAIPGTMGAENPRFDGPDLLCFARFVPGTLPPRAHGFQIAIQRSDGFGASAPQQPGGPCGAVPSRGGSRRVILQTGLKGFHPGLDIGGHTILKGLTVYAPPFQVPSYSFKVHGSRVRDPSAELSADGRHLAVLGSKEMVLEMYDLPPQK